jgi:hypothetical protein
MKLAIPEDTSGIPWLGEAQLPQPNAPLEARMLAHLESLALANPVALGAALAADLDGAWVDLGLSANFNLDSRRIREFRKLPLTLLLAAVWAGEERQPEEAVAYLLKAMSAGKVFHSGALLHHLTRRNIESRACDVLERLLNRAELPEASLKALESAWSQEQPRDLAEAFREVRCREIWALEQLRANPIGSVRFTISSETGWLASAKSWGNAALLAYSDQGYRDQDFVQILDAWAKFSAALDQPAAQRLAQLKALADQIHLQQGRRAVAWNFAVIPKFFSRVEQDLDIIVRLRTARVALAVLRWRAAHEGKLPESLSELVPDTLPGIPVDPFDEQPLRYRRLPQGFSVYSVGPDFTDNGGQRQPAGTEKTAGYDVVFTVGR